MATILVVDDDFSIRTMLREIFEAAGHLVVDAADGALALLRVRETRPDLVVTDIEMPVMDGFQLIQGLHGQEGLGRLPVIIVSGRDWPSGSADIVFRKPFEPKALLAASDELLSAAPVR